MSKQLHKSFRSVMNIVESSYDLNGSPIPIKIVYWVIIDRKNSKSVYTKHYAATVYIGSMKHSSVTARMPNKAVRWSQDLLSQRDLNEALSNALYSYLGGKEYTGKVIWTDNGTSMVRCNETQLEHVLYSCNIKGADSAFPELVKNISIKSGDKVKFLLDKDPYISSHCGATKAELI